MTERTCTTAGTYRLRVGTADDTRLVIIAPDGTEHGRYEFIDAINEVNRLNAELRATKGVD
jgi:hypothetical protein